MNKGVLLLNIGSPDSPCVKDVKRYLGKFLMDPYVLDMPWILRWLLVHGVILRTRPQKSADAYASIWTQDGSPLISISKDFAKALSQASKLPVEIGMAYGSPSVEDGITALLSQSVTELMVVPMFPHYAMSTTEGIIARFKKAMKSFGDVPYRIAPPFYNQAAYTSGLANSLKDVVADEKTHILFSYHGLPERHIKKTDPTGTHCLQSANCCADQANKSSHSTCYKHQIYETTRLVTDSLNLAPSRYSVSFQSRLGKDVWLAPYTDATLAQLAKDGKKHLAVICPAFAVDCLETLEEIGIEGKRTFLENGGETFTLIPCLNSDPEWVSGITKIISQ